ncbi:MAG: secretin N-terminal domain-containing protein, partial [Candidatus Margulisiibacteriota bacterium]
MRKIIWAAVLLIVMSSLSASAKDLFLQIQQEAAQEQKAAPQAPSEPADANYSMKTIYINYIAADEVKSTISNILAQGEGVSLNASTNSIVVRASGKNIGRIEKVIKSIDKPPLQVHVQAKIIEVQTGNGDNTNPSTFGFSWQYLGSSATNFGQFIGQQPATLDAVTPGMYAQVVKNNLKAYFAALEKKGNYDIVASPSITAINHQEAEIFIGGKIGYRNLLTTTTGTLQDVQYLETGTKLRFTPHITNDGYIRMAIYPSISEGSLTNDGLPVQSTTETKNFVLVKDGETVVIAGLTKNYKTKTEIGVPYISAIPILGNFFKRTELVQQKRDIMVLITHTIINQEFNNKMRDKAALMETEQNKKIDDTKLI